MPPFSRLLSTNEAGWPWLWPPIITFPREDFAFSRPCAEDTYRHI